MRSEGSKATKSFVLNLLDTRDYFQVVKNATVKVNSPLGVVSATNSASQDLLQRASVHIGEIFRSRGGAEVFPGPSTTNARAFPPRLDYRVAGIKSCAELLRRRTGRVFRYQSHIACAGLEFALCSVSSLLSEEVSYYKDEAFVY